MAGVRTKKTDRDGAMSSWSQDWRARAPAMGGPGLMQPAGARQRQRPARSPWSLWREPGLPVPWPQTSASQTGREYFCVVLGTSVCGDLWGQSCETKTTQRKLHCRGRLWTVEASSCKCGGGSCLHCSMACRLAVGQTHTELILAVLNSLNSEF